MKLSKSYLDKLYQKYNKRNSVLDPIFIVHRFYNQLDIESFGFIASVYSLGNINQILATIEKIFNLVEKNPYEFINSSNTKFLQKSKIQINHRFFDHNDFIGLIITLKTIYKKYKSLQNYFNSFYTTSVDLRDAVSRFSQDFNKTLSFSFSNKPIKKNFIPNPKTGSPCKRINLFLRWMVRKDEVDFGIWDIISPDKLIIPLDTHIYKVAQFFELTTLKFHSWKMAEEITKNLKKFDSKDPVKYDFALSHINIKYFALET